MTVKPRPAYSSCSASSVAYWGVSPQRLATFTTRAALPSARAPNVVSSPWRVVTGSWRRSLMRAAATCRPRSFQAAGVVRHVDGVLPQGLERHDLQRPDV